MKEKMDNPGVHIPPPFFVVIIFITGIFIQKYIPINPEFFHTTPAIILGILLLVATLFFVLPALLQFFKTKNTVITFHPAHSLQMNGIYKISRNPMYVGLFLFYLGLSLLIGNWWHFIIFPILFFIIREYVVRREEQYLQRRFGTSYLEYKKQTRRWL